MGKKLWIDEHIEQVQSKAKGSGVRKSPSKPKAKSNPKHPKRSR